MSYPFGTEADTQKGGSFFQKGRARLKFMRFWWGVPKMKTDYPGKWTGGWTESTVGRSNLC